MHACKRRRRRDVQGAVQRWLPWAALFATVGGLGILLMLAALLLLPELPAFLASGRARRPLARLNRARAGGAWRCPPPCRRRAAAETGRIALGALFAGGLARNSVLLWSAVTLGYVDLCS